MRSNIIPESNNSIELIAEYFKIHEKPISQALSWNTIQWEADLINVAESVISDTMAFDLHFDMIVNQGTNAVTNYYKGLINGKNEILERAKVIVKAPNAAKIEESISQFKKSAKEKITKMLNENTALDALSATNLSNFQQQFTSALQSVRAKNAAPQAQPGTAAPATPAATLDPSTATTAEIDQALAGGGSEKKDIGVFGTIRDLWNAITEGGSAIGILHLVLDIIGVVGDFIVPGVGAIADIINAIIYFCRGKWMLGTISLIAGLLFGAGDALKLLKGSAGTAEKVMVKVAEKGSKEGAEELAKVSAKEQGGVIKLLRYIAKNISGVIGKAVGMLGKFIEGFVAKLAGWIPLIGKPLKGFFEKIGQMFGRYAEKMTNFSKGFSKVESEALQIAAKEADGTLEAFFKSEGEMTINASTGMVKCTDKSGKVIGKEFSAELLSNPKIMNSKFPNLFKAGEKEAIAKYYTSVAKSGSKFTESTVSNLVKLKLASARAAARLPFFIGKQVIKLITGKPFQDAGYKPSEVEYFGNAALQSWIQDKANKQREDTGATYIPAVNLDSSDKETFDNIVKYQNTYAKLFDQPQIIPVVYDKYGRDEEEDEEAKPFWDEVKKESKSTDSLASAKETKKETNESVSNLKYIIPFSKFSY
jgi:hypothetical protein